MGPTCRHLSAAILAAVTAVWASVAAAATITLPDAIDRALHYAPAVDVATATTDMSVAHVTEQRAPLFPTLASGVEYYQGPGYNPIITNRGLSTALLTLDYTAWDWGRRQARLRAAEYVLEASRLGVAAARAQIVFDTTVAYFDLLRAHAAQMYLQYRGFDPHGLDGILGPATADAIRAFQTSAGMQATGTLDDGTMQALLPA